MVKNYAYLETSTLTLKFDLLNGSLVSLYSKVSDWHIFNREHLALSWRFMLPLEEQGKRNNNAWGHLQATKPTCEYDDKRVIFHWPQIESECGGVHKIAVTTECVIEHDQAVFKMHIDNQDTVFVENVYYPYLGDLHRPMDAERFVMYRYAYAFRFEEFELWPTFRNDVGTHSVDYPTLTIAGASNPPMQPYTLLADNNGNGLYMGVTQRRIEPITWHAEAIPGWRNSNDFRLFSEDHAEGYDVYTRFCAGHMPYVEPGTKQDLLPFAFEGYKGDWDVGTGCYTRISKQWNKLPSMPEWAKHPHSWFQIHINSPEDELRIKFKDLPKVGADCKKNGVDVIQLVGWNEGGQDRGNPSHTPDPRLGTFEELKQAIKEIREMGIKLILFAKFTWADESHPEFKEVYEPLAIKNPYGDYYNYRGYQYMTISQMADVNTRRLIPMCFHSDKFTEICKEEFQKCIDLGADGILYDENQHHANTLCCFDTSHGHRYGISTYSADERLIDEFREMVKGTDFMIAGETSYDFMMNYYDVSYGRTWGRDHIPSARMQRPEANIMTAVIGFNDRSMLNQCLMNRYIISYEPFNFKGMLSDYPSTVAYGMKMDKLRTDLRDYFWDGRFQNRIGGKVVADGEKHVHYAVFKSVDDKLGMVICNYDEEKSITVIPTLCNGDKLTQYRLVDEECLVPFNGSFVIPPMSAAAVI